MAKTIQQNNYVMVKGRVVVLSNNFDEIAGQSESRIINKMQTGMQNFLLVADRLTPVDEGLLKANKTIHVPSRSFGSNPKGKIIWNQHYGIYQEFGTVYNPPVLFATRAAAMVMPGYVRSFDGVFEGGSIF